MEHRWGNRHEVNKPVNIGTRSGIAARGRIRNVSLSGALVESPLPVEVYSYVQVQFTNGRRITSLVEGQVVRKDVTAFGIEWREFAPDPVRQLLAASAVATSGSHSSNPRLSTLSTAGAVAVEAIRMPG